jgi:hypothetical protein
MRILDLTTAAKDLDAQVVPFVPNNTVLALSAAGATLEQSDVVGSGYTDLVALTAGIAKEVTLDQQFIRVKSGGTQAQLIGN